MQKFRTYLCPLAAVSGFVALVLVLAVSLRAPPAPVVAVGAQDPPIIRLLDVGGRTVDDAWHDDFVEATIGDTALWIDRDAAQPWREEIARAARLTNISPALIAEVVGMESGFRNVHNPRSTAFGFGQQLANNQIMRACRLDRAIPAQSILGSALELRWDLDRFGGSLEKALDAYGTTARLDADLRRRVLARMRLASQRI